MGKKDKKQTVAGSTLSSTNDRPVASTSAAPAAVVAKTAKVASTANKTSEIDDIFAGKKILPVKIADTEASTSTSNTAESKSSKKKKRKLQNVANESLSSATNGSKTDSNAVTDKDLKGKGKSTVQNTVTEAKAPAVTVVDASSIPGLSKKRKTDKISEGGSSSKGTATPATSAAAKEEDDLFRDSRGTSTRRKTDDGLPIYDIKELNIGLGGDTELCPFDCQCCF